jgi:hypothetical protein
MASSTQAPLLLADSSGDTEVEGLLREIAEAEEEVGSLLSQQQEQSGELADARRGLARQVRLGSPPVAARRRPSPPVPVPGKRAARIRPSPCAADG